MKSYYYVQAQDDKTDSGWTDIGKFGTLAKAEAFAKKVELKYPMRYSRSGPEWLCIENR